MARLSRRQHLAYHVNQRVILYVKPKLGIEPGIFSLNFVVISFLSKSKTGDLLNHFKICHWSIDPIWPAWLQLVESKATLKLKFVPNHFGHVFGLTMDNLKAIGHFCLKKGSSLWFSVPFRIFFYFWKCNWRNNLLLFSKESFWRERRKYVLAIQFGRCCVQVIIYKTEF